MKSKRFVKKRKKNNLLLRKQTRGKTDFLLIFLTFILSIFGLVMIFNVSYPSAISDFGDKYYYFKEQMQWIVVGAAVLLFFAFFDYHRLYNLSVPLLIASILVLSAVFIPGIGVKAQGASRWIKIGVLNFQPSEFAKLALIIYLSSWFSNKEKGRLISFLVLMSLLILLIILQPDLGSASIICIVAVILYFLSNSPFWHFLFLIPLVSASGIILAVISPYRLARVTTLFNPNIDPEGISYHLKQVLLALGSGGLFGLGLGQSRQKFSYLPEATTDSIFAVIGEELGFIGCTLIIFSFAIIFIRGYNIAQKASDKLGMLLASGLTFSLIFQALVNFSSMVALIPLTGIPLPFLSYGGSNLIVSFAMIGILVNISKQS